MRRQDRWLYLAVHGTAPPPRKRCRRLFNRGPIRDYRYRAFIRRHPCAVCGITKGVECAHTGPHGLDIKGPDTETIALCWWDHWGSGCSLHKVGPQEFERLHGLKIGALVNAYQAEWTDERRRES